MHFTSLLLLLPAFGAITTIPPPELTAVDVQKLFNATAAKISNSLDKFDTKIDTSGNDINSRLNTFGKDGSGANHRLGTLEHQLAKIEDRFDSFGKRFDFVNNRLRNFKYRLITIHNRLTKIEDNNEHWKAKVSDKLEKLRNRINYLERGVQNSTNVIRHISRSSRSLWRSSNSLDVYLYITKIRLHD
jgi:chromosome segregation ATPase